MRTLIVYATKTGTVKNAVGMIAEKLKQKPDIVDLEETKKIEIAGYDFVLLGGSIHMGRVNKTVKRFLAKNRKTLLGARFGFFLASGYPQELEKYFDAILDADLKAHAEIKTSIGYAYYLENMGPVWRRVVEQMANTSQSIEKYKPDAIMAIADIINGKPKK